jgi:hypothetical protein
MEENETECKVSLYVKDKGFNGMLTMDVQSI